MTCEYPIMFIGSHKGTIESTCMAALLKLLLQHTIPLLVCAHIRDTLTTHTHIRRHCLFAKEFAHSYQCTHKAH